MYNMNEEDYMTTTGERVSVPLNTTVFNDNKPNNTALMLTVDHIRYTWTYALVTLHLDFPSDSSTYIITFAEYAWIFLL
jgi:hypothetical protein